MIRKIKASENQPYFRPNDDSYLVPVTATNEDEDAIQIRKRSLRSFRKQFTWAMTAFTFGSLLILFQSPVRNEFLAPGHLTSNHAQILNGLGAERCNACHTVGNQTFMQWAVSSLQTGRNVQECQSELCMKCHSKTMDKAFAKLPHNVDRALLNAMRKTPVVAVGLNETQGDSNDGNIECSTCHREHHGNRDLTSLTDQQCQTCHQQPFDSFENGHPEFTNWPQSRRQGIAFDHASHHFKHFPSSKTEFACKMCHVDDSYSNVKLLAPYEQSCAKCHEKDIQIRSEPGLSLVNLPMLDLDAIQEQGLSVGSWPENATGDFDGEVSELMQLLLSSDSEFLEIATRRNGDLTFSDFEADSKQDVMDAVAITWCIKRLFYDLATGGTDELREKYSTAMGLSRDDSRLYLITQGVDASVFAEAANRWFPEIAEEVPNRTKTENNRTASHDQLSDPWLAQRQPERDSKVAISNDPVLNYFPSKHSGGLDELAVNPLTNLLRDESQSAVETEQRSGNTQGIEFTETQPLFRGPQNVQNQVDSTKSRPEQRSPMNSKEPNLGTNRFLTHRIPEDQLLAANPIRSMDLPQTVPDSTQQSQSSLSKRLSPGPIESEPNWLTGEPNEPAAVVNRVNPTSNSPAVALNSSGIETAQIPDEELLAKNPLQLQTSKLSNSSQGLNAAPGEQPQDSKIAANSPLFDSERPGRKDLNSSIAAQEFADALEQRKQDSTGQGKSGGFAVTDAQAPDEVFVGASQDSGWFRNDHLYQISYRPAKHADIFLTSMMDLVSAVPHTKNNPAVGKFFQRMVSNDSIGACNDCHTVDSESSHYRVNWKANYRNPAVRSFTNFSHGPHLIQQELADCTACHQLDSQLSNAHTFEHFDSGDVISNFRRITKSNCVSCHHARGAGNGCTQCHDYHVGARILSGQ